jgi:hypothetical protein
LQATLIEFVQQKTFSSGQARHEPNPGTRLIRAQEILLPILNDLLSLKNKSFDLHWSKLAIYTGPLQDA